MTTTMFLAKGQEYDNISVLAMFEAHQRQKYDPLLHSTADSQKSKDERPLANEDKGGNKQLPSIHEWNT